MGRNESAGDLNFGEYNSLIWTWITIEAARKVVKSKSRLAVGIFISWRRCRGGGIFAGWIGRTRTHFISAGAPCAPLVYLFEQLRSTNQIKPVQGRQKPQFPPALDFPPPLHTSEP
jgi:hypothetical protein